MNSKKSRNKIFFKIADIVRVPSFGRPWFFPYGLSDVSKG